MKKLYPLASALVLGLALTACNKPEAPAKTEADVMRATAEGQAKVNEAATDAAVERVENAADAREDGEALSNSDLRNDVDNMRKVDEELAHANYKVAKEKCDALTGEMKSACLTQADATHELELAQAKNAEKAAKDAIAADPK